MGVIDEITQMISELSLQTQLQIFNTLSCEQVMEKIRDVGCKSVFFLLCGSVGLELEIFNHKMEIAVLEPSDIVHGTSFSVGLLNLPELRCSLGFSAPGSTRFQLHSLDTEEAQFFEYDTVRLQLLNHSKFLDTMKVVYECIGLDYGFENFYYNCKSERRNIEEFIAVRQLDADFYQNISSELFFFETEKVFPNIHLIDFEHIKRLKLLEMHVDNDPFAVHLIRCACSKLFLEFLRQSNRSNYPVDNIDGNVPNTLDRFLSPRLRMNYNGLECVIAEDSYETEELSTAVCNVDENGEVDVAEFLYFDNVEFGIESGTHTPEHLKVSGFDEDLLKSRFDELDIDVISIPSRNSLTSGSAENLLKNSHFQSFDRTFSVDGFNIVDDSLAEFNIEKTDNFEISSSLNSDSSYTSMTNSCFDLDTFGYDDNQLFTIMKNILNDLDVLEYEHLQILQESCMDSGPFLTNKFDVSAFSRRPITSYYLFLVLFQFLGVIKQFNLKEQRLRQFFFDVIETMSQHNAYHNRSHVLDVLYISVFFIAHSTIDSFKPEELLSVGLATICHDCGHPGLNEACLRKIDHDITKAFPDASPLEKLHLKITKHTITASGLLSHLGSGVVDRIISNVEQLIISTDMALHSKILHSATALEGLTLEQIPPEKRIIFLQLFIKAVDISNVTKSFSLAKRWAQRYYREVQDMVTIAPSFAPDLSPPLPASLADVCKQQIGFINFLALPLFTMLTECYTEINFVITNIKHNLRKYSSISDKLSF
ncbi:hypothetical protein PCE1_001700 [Barthelona sp. PCE]